eukprot:1158724-Pelagomonas_calceolata.AAC.2
MNTTSEKIQMTAPVAIQQPEGQQPEQQKTVMLAAARDNVPLSTDPKDVELWGYNPPDGPSAVVSLKGGLEEMMSKQKMCFAPQRHIGSKWQTASQGDHILESAQLAELVKSRAHLLGACIAKYAHSKRGSCSSKGLFVDFSQTFH